MQKTYMKTQIFLAFFIGHLIPSFAFAFYTCGQVKDLGSTTAYSICDASGKIQRIEKVFKDTGTPSVVETFKNEKMVLRQNFNTSHELIQEFGFEYPDQKTFFKLVYKLDVLPRVEVSRLLFKGSPYDEKVVKLAEWVYEKDDEGRPVLKVVDHYKADLIVKRDIYESSEKTETYVYAHPKSPSVFKHVDGFVAIDADGGLIKRYSSGQPIDVRKYVDSPNKLKIQSDQNRRRIAVFDTGFDVSHSDLSYKFYLNLIDEIDGLDNDGNGVVDDLIGWSVSDDGLFSNNINEEVSVKPKVKPYKPFSHGTHVASVALDEVENFALTAFAGNMSDVGHLNKISDLISREPIEFVNMSFSLGDYKDPMAPARESFNALKSLIRKNAKTVFVVAAGNGAQDLDGSGVGRKEYPASYGLKNIMTVGALDSSSAEEFRMPFDRPIFFSAFCKKSVDVFAPGHKIKGAAVGGDYIKVSGTSMAAPYTLNIMLKMATAFPNLSSHELKDVILYSAYIPNIDDPLDCTSGGMLFPRRAFEVAKRFSKLGGLVKDAALKVRAEESIKLPGEETNEDYLNQVKSLWAERGLL